MKPRDALAFRTQGQPAVDQFTWDLRSVHFMHPLQESRCLRYSSKVGAAEIDWRLSSLTSKSGSRVSAMPPAPFFAPSLNAIVLEVRTGAAGLKAAAPATRARRRV